MSKQTEVGNYNMDIFQLLNLFNQQEKINKIQNNVEKKEENIKKKAKIFPNEKLYKAIIKNDTEEVSSILLESNKSSKAKTEDLKKIENSCIFGKVLSSSINNLNAKEELKLASFHYAVLNNNGRLIKYLIDNETNFNFKKYKDRESPEIYYVTKGGNKVFGIKDEALIEVFPGLKKHQETIGDKYNVQKTQEPLQLVEDSHPDHSDSVSHLGANLEHAPA